VGLTALVAAVLAGRIEAKASLDGGVGVGASVGALIGGVSMKRKAREADLEAPDRTWSKICPEPGPTARAGALISFALARADSLEVLPGIWLLLYGAGVVTGEPFRCGWFR
jgi:hypothetical protein